MPSKDQAFALASGRSLPGLVVVQVLADEASFLRVMLEGGSNPGYQFKTHPNIDKGLYSSQNMLGLKDPERPFPTGAPLGEWGGTGRGRARVLCYGVCSGRAAAGLRNSLKRGSALHWAHDVGTNHGAVTLGKEKSFTPWL
jgi:hypothetical protein